MIDNDEADDKIIAVLEADAAFGAFADIAQVPRPLVDRLPGATSRKVEISDVYGADVAREVITRSFKDYGRRFP